VAGCRNREARTTRTLSGLQGLVSTSRGSPLRRVYRLDVAPALSPEQELPLVAFAWTTERQTRSSSTVLVGYSRLDLEVPTCGLRGVRAASRLQRMASPQPPSRALRLAFRDTPSRCLRWVPYE